MRTNMFLGKRQNFYNLSAPGGWVWGCVRANGRCVAIWRPLWRDCWKPLRSISRYKVMVRINRCWVVVRLLVMIVGVWARYSRSHTLSATLTLTLAAEPPALLTFPFFLVVRVDPDPDGSVSSDGVISVSWGAEVWVTISTTFAFSLASTTLTGSQSQRSTHA